MTLYHNSRMILHAFASRSPKTSSTNSKSVIFTLFPNFRSTNPKESGKQSPFNPLCVHSFCKAQKHLWRYVISPEASLEIWRYVLRPEASLEICCTVFCWTYQRSLIHWTSVSMPSSRIFDVASLWWLTECGQARCHSRIRTQQHTINKDFCRPLRATC